MPLNADNLGAAIKTAVDDAAFQAPAINAGESAEAYRTRLQGLLSTNRELALDAIASAIVTHITGNLTVAVTAIAPSGGGPCSVSVTVS